MVSLEVMIYIDGNVLVSVIVVTVIPKPQALGIRYIFLCTWSQWLNSQSLDSATMLADSHRFHPYMVGQLFSPSPFFSLFPFDFAIV